MIEPAPAAARDAGPPPGPRRRPSWVRRHCFASSVLALVVLTLALRLAWGWHSGRQLAAALEDLRRRGHPTASSDFRDAPVPDHENAWLVYARAISAMKKGVESPRASLLEYPPYPPYGPEWEASAAAAERDHAAAFPLARRARLFPHSQFPLPAKDRARSLSIHWTNARRLANTLADAAEYSHLHGNDAESVERLLDVLQLGRSVRLDPALISQFIGMGIDAIASDAAQKVVPTLRLDDAGGGTPASPDRARALIASLLNERALRESFSESLRRERAVMLDMLRDPARETWAIRPLADRTALRWLSDMHRIVEAGDRANAAEARPILKELEARQPTLASLLGNGPAEDDFPRYSRWFEPQGGPEGIARAVETFYRDSAERRATAFVVAARLYRHDTGRWPDDAAALVPKYLDSIPADPFRSDGGPLGYVVHRGALPDGGDRPLVVIEAGNGPDPRGDFIDTEPMYLWCHDPRRAADEHPDEIRQFRDVSFWTPKTRRFDEYRRLAEEAVNDDPDESDAPGNNPEHNDPADGPPKQ